MLTAEEAATAKTLGWQLEEVYDLDKKRLMLTVMPVDFPMISAAQMQGVVIGQARARNPVALKALKLIAASNVSRRSK